MAEVLVSVDIEADGPTPGTYSMLSLGACVVGRPSESFYAEMRPISAEYVPEALAVSGLDRAELTRSGEYPSVAMGKLDLWLGRLDGRPVFCSFSSWDWTYVYWYLMRYVGRSQFGHSSLDMKSYYMGRYGTAWRDTSKSRIARARPHLLRDAGPHTHNALDDAREQAVLLERMLECNR